jgi:predicted kinase
MRSILRGLGCGLALRERIAAVVRYHGRPPYLLEMPDPTREIIRLSWLVNHRLLYLFAVADTRGRSTAETSRAEDNVHMWKLAAEEQGCFDKPYLFANDLARFLFYHGGLSSLYYTPHEEYRCTVTMLCGLPGAGKDTWLKRHRRELPMVSLDEVRDEIGIDPADDQGQVIQAAREDCRALLRARRDFSFNATNIIPVTRKRWIDLFAEYQARVELIYLEPPLLTVIDRNKNRAKAVPESIMQRLIEKLDPPTWAEAHGLTLVE